MEMNKIDKLKNVHDIHEQMNKVETDDASKLWKQYQKQNDKKKKLSKILFFSCVLVIIVILVIVGLYIVLSTADPLHSL